MIEAIDRAMITGARSLKGARWRHRGRKPWAVDCIGLVVVGGARGGIEIEDERYYGREPWEDRLRKGCQRRWGAPLQPWEAKPGMVALIQWRSDEPSHLGVIGDHPDGGLSLIHAHNLHGVIEQRIAGAVAAAIIEVYRLPRPA